MKPMEFYRLAVAMAPRATSEQWQRTVVGRLYYGLHHEACCRYYRTNPNAAPVERSSRHASLLRRFNRPNDKESAKVANLLHQLRHLRTQADYELGQMYDLNRRPVTSAQVLSSATHVAELLLQALNAYSLGEAPDGCLCRLN